MFGAAALPCVLALTTRKQNAERVGARRRVVRLRSSAACARNVLSGRALGALNEIELNGIAFGERLEASALNGTVVNERVFLAAVGGDEPEALRVVEPLHFSGRAHT